MPREVYRDRAHKSSEAAAVYSARKADKTSMRKAWRAGTMHATIAVMATSPATPRYVIGSRGLTSNRRVAMIRESNNAAAVPIAMPTRTGLRP